jgi:hypothetical protein
VERAAHVIALLLFACGGDATAPPRTVASRAPGEARADRDDLGWVSAIVLDPASYAATVEKAPDGWEAMRAHAYAQAEQAFNDDALGRARASFALAVLYDDLSHATGVAVERLFTRWETRGGLPAGEAPVVAALAAWCSGGESAGSWASRVPEGPGKAIAAAVALDRAPFSVATADPYGRRMRVHQQARGAMDPAPLLAVADQPIVAGPPPPPARPGRKSTPPPPAFDPEQWDPCLYRSLSDIWTERLARATGGTGWRSAATFASPTAGLSGTLFAPWPSADDLRAGLHTAERPGLLGARSPRMRQLGVGATAFSADDPKATEAELRTLDAGLDAWSKKLLDQASPEGATVLRDVDPIHRFRQEWLLTRARLALEVGHPRRALALLQAARDSATPAIGSRNAPQLYALLAQTHLRLGEVQAAADAVQELSRAHPEARGLAETVADLVVVESMPPPAPSKKR